MLKRVVAGALLLMGFGVAALGVASPEANASPLNNDCVNCGPSRPYDTESAPRIRREMDRQRQPETYAPAEGESAANPEPAREAPPPSECSNDCPPPKHYDSIEVVKTSHDVDQSRVINTDSVVHVRPRVREINKLVIHENETRNVGVIQHNHRIIEKEIRYVKRVPVYRQQQPAYRVVQRVETVLVPVAVQSGPPCGCPCTCSGSGYGYAQGYVYSGGYAYATNRAAVQQVLVPVAVPPGYGYR